MSKQNKSLKLPPLSTPQNITLDFLDTRGRVLLLVVQKEVRRFCMRVVKGRAEHKMSRLLSFFSQSEGLFFPHI